MSEKPKRSRRRRIMSILASATKHIFLHNGFLKLIAILISLVLWAGLISQDENVTRDKTFQNVNVSVTGTEIMKNNGYIVVSDLDEALDDVSVVAAVPQKQFEKAEASAYNIRLDLSKINGTGEQELKIQSTNSSTFGRVVSTSPSSVNVTVEDYIIRQRIPVSVIVNGETPQGWYMSTPSVDPALVAVSGPRQLVQTISRARAFIHTDDIEWKEGTLITNSEIVLYNRTGEKIDSPLLTIMSSGLTIDSVLIDATILPTRLFATTGQVQTTGSVARGYRVSDVKISPETITVAAREEVLEQMTELPMERTVNVKNLKETTVFQLKVQKPSDDAFLSNETVTVTVEIEPEDNRKGRLVPPLSRRSLDCDCPDSLRDRTCRGFWRIPAAVAAF